MAMMLALLMAATATPVPMTSQGPWVVNGDENLCYLQRKFSDGKQEATLVFQPLLDLSTMELSIISKDKSSTTTGEAAVTLSSSNRTFKGRYFSTFNANRNRRLTRITIDRVLLTTIKDGDDLIVDARPVAARFPIKRPDKALPILQECVDSMKKSWGVDPESKAAVAVQPTGNPAAYFGPDAYPVAAFSEGISGRVIALLQVSANGKVEHCRIVSSAAQALNEGTCTAAYHIRFKPALGQDGKPIASTYLLPVNWVMP
ncbi:energy transducer TonB [Sphingomonas immobilis]|uniref:Energy transducer TonB n=1 Tax=Sphingomonas immobilis TaxID=3063997 RepID=A0ABT9A124_9SPHN|nr:energy transducer TonB [Sphingomonas sp. CA1-15]MDO7842960.1 energy transducer TonB [Sphingomonas sp. CA1-15]